jgi:hypothetical protein
MSKFKTKYKLSPSAIDTLQYVRPNAEPTTNKDQGTKMKDPNYMISANKAVSSNKDLHVIVEQLSGKGVNISKNIKHEIEENPIQDLSTSFGKFATTKRRLFKKDGIIYDLLN